MKTRLIALAVTVVLLVGLRASARWTTVRPPLATPGADRDPAVF